MGLVLLSEAYTLKLLWDFILQNGIDISRIAISNAHG